MKLLLLATLSAATLQSILSAQTVTLTPVADTFLSSANAASNYGGAGALGMSAAGLPKGEFDSLMRFDFAPAKASFDTLYGVGGWSLQSVTLALTATSPGNPIFNGNAAGPGGSNINFAGQIAFQWIQNDTWVEGTGTPGTPTTNGITFSGLSGILSVSDETLGAFVFAGGTSGVTNVALPLTPSFNADATAGQLVSFLAQPADSGVSALFSSRSVGTASLRPALTVTAVPEPCGVLLTFAGLMVLAARRDRARAKTQGVSRETARRRLR